MPESLYRYIWSINRRGQIKLILLTALVFPLSMVPLELQRRIIDDAVKDQDLRLLLWLCGGYLLLLLVQGGFKYLMHMQRGRTIQHARSHLRNAIYFCSYTLDPDEARGREAKIEGDDGAVVSMLSSEVEKLGEFIGESISAPLLHGGTMVAILGYMIWVEPIVALIGMAVYSPQMIIIPLMQQRINACNREYAQQLRELGDFVVSEDESEKQERDMPEPFGRLVRNMYFRKMHAEWLKYVMKFARNFINNLGPLSILLIGGWFVIQGRTELGTIVAFLSGFEKISGPWTELIKFYREVSNSRMKYRLMIDAFPALPDDTRGIPEPELA